MLRSIVLLAILLSPPAVRAERFMSIEQAQKLCYPAADHFESRTVRFSPDQTKAIQAATGQRVPNKGNRTWSAWQGTNLLGTLIFDQVLGKHEVIDYAVAIAPTGTVQRVEILEYRESHGSDIRGAKWREQFKGKTSQSKLKLNDDVYNISGATISCRHVTEGVRRVLATYELVIQRRPGAAALPAGHQLQDQPAGQPR